MFKAFHLSRWPYTIHIPVHFGVIIFLWLSPAQKQTNQHGPDKVFSSYEAVMLCFSVTVPAAVK